MKNLLRLVIPLIGWMCVWYFLTVILVIITPNKGWTDYFISGFIVLTILAVLFHKSNETRSGMRF